jgi:CheY-like chemotaxis protein
MILVVDDVEPVRTVTGRMLERMGFGVVTAPAATEAMLLLHRHAALIVGVMLKAALPRLESGQLFREIQRAKSNTPIILTSSSPEEDVIRRFGEHAYVSFLAKPYSFTELKAIFQHLALHQPLLSAAR